MPLNAAQRFERDVSMHDTKTSKGLVNLVTSQRWIRHSDRLVQERTRDVLTARFGHLQHPTVLVIGVGGGGIFGWMFREPGTKRIGVDINHAVLTKARQDHGPQYFNALEADAGDLPIADASVDVLVFDFVLHHLVGQDVLERALREAARVTRPGGFIVAREPSSFSPSGMILNAANRFRLMHVISGASNYEFALSPPGLLRSFEQYGSVVDVCGLTYLFAHRLPIWMQNAMAAVDRRLTGGTKLQWVADFLLYVVQTNAMPENAAAAST